MVNYGNGKIYKLVNTVNDKIYIGSTCNVLSKSFNEHKSKAKTNDRPVYKYLNTISWNNIRIILIENVIAENKAQLLQREQHYIDLLKPELNKQSAYAYCPHGRQHSLCKDCGGASICQHNRIKSRCKDCGGGSICIHNREKSQCKDCGGSQICLHNRVKSQCKDCGGGSICPHNRQKSQCKDCGGGSICIHNRVKSQCKDCGGGSICPHNKRKSSCKDCDPFRYYCYECEKSFSSKARLEYHESTKKHRGWIKQLEKYCDDSL